MQTNKRGLMSKMRAFIYRWYIGHCQRSSPAGL